MLTDDVVGDQVDGVDGGSLPETADTRRGWLERHRITLPEALVLLAAGLYPIARASFLFPSTPRIALLLVAGVPGLVVLGVRVARRDAPSTVLLLFLIVALVSGLLAREPLYSMKGDVRSYLSVTVLWLVAGWWAAGTCLRDRARGVLPWVLTIAVAANAAVAVLQIALDIRSGPLGTFSGRGSGLMDNAVYYGSLCAGVASWSVYRAASATDRRWLALVAGLSFAGGLSGSRVSLAVVVATALILLVLWRTARAAAALISVAVGFVTASLFGGLWGAGPSLSDRVGSTSDINGRTSIWRYGLEAFADRPLLGWGPNQFGTATWHRYTFEFVRDTKWREGDQAWVDPHNVVVLALATVGIFGTGLLVAFVVVVLRRGVHVELLVLVAGIAGTWLLQPTRNTLPIAMLVLGAAMLPRHDAHVADPALPVGVPVPALAVASCLAVVLAAYFILGDLRLKAAVASGDVEATAAAGEWFYRDPVVAGVVADQLAGAAIRPPNSRDAAVEWSRRVTDYVPYSPVAWSRHAERQIGAGDLDGAKDALDRALEAQEWSPSARRVAVLYARAIGDVALAEESMAAACDLRLRICETPADSAAALPVP